MLVGCRKLPTHPPTTPRLPYYNFISQTGCGVPPLTECYFLHTMMVPPRYRLGTASHRMPIFTYSHGSASVPPRYRLGTASHRMLIFAYYDGSASVPPLAMPQYLRGSSGAASLPPRYRLDTASRNASIITWFQRCCLATTLVLPRYHA